MTYLALICVVIERCGGSLAFPCLRWQ